MKRYFGSLIALCIMLAMLAPAALAQQDARPYHEGTVWQIAFIRVKAGMEDRYARYLANDWKREQEAFKKAGYILDYKVIATEPHGPQDFDLMLMTQYRDLASMEANADKAQQMAIQLFGGQQKVETGYQDRASFREVMGSRLGREIVLQPKAMAAK